MTNDQFQCAQCGGVFDKGQTDEEAVAEKEKYFGKSLPIEDCAVICDDCFNEIHPEKFPHLAEEAVKAHADFNSHLETILGAMGVPKQIFVGATESATPDYSRYLDARYERVRAWYQEQVKNNFIEPMLEQYFPERYWEQVYLFSPRSKAFKRRANPITLKYETRDEKVYEFTKEKSDEKVVP